MGTPEDTRTGGGGVHVRFACEDGDTTEGLLLGVDDESVTILTAGRIVRRATVTRNGDDRVFDMQPISRSERVPGAHLARAVANVALRRAA